MFTSGRALGRLDKNDWITAALRVDWQRFTVDIARVVELGNVVIVDHNIEQEMESSPDWSPDAPRQTRWTTTDVWVVEAGTFRLASRHPEMTA